MYHTSVAIEFAPWQAYLVLSQWLYGVCSTGRWLYVGSVLAVFYRLVVVGLQGILLAGGGMNTACFMDVLWAGRCVPAVCSMGRQ